MRTLLVALSSSPTLSRAYHAAFSYLGHRGRPTKTSFVKKNKSKSKATAIVYGNLCIKKNLTTSHALQMPSIKAYFETFIWIVLKFDINVHLRDDFQKPPVDGLISTNQFKSNSDHIPWAGNIALTTNFAILDRRGVMIRK